MAATCVGGLWPAVESFIVFVVTNIFTHAATLISPSGADTKYTVGQAFIAILLPQFFGNHAFHSLRRWWQRLSSRVRRETSWSRKARATLKSVIPGDSLEDAVMTGAVALRIPDEYTEVLRGRWDPVLDYQKVVISDLNHAGFEKHPDYYPREGVIAHGERGKSTPFFLLPPTVRLKRRNKKYSLAPTSSFLSQAVAIFQLFVSARQLYINYDSGITAIGLASPYLIVIPYIVMTLVHFVANALVGSYPQVVVLPDRKKTSSTEIPAAGTSGQSVTGPGEKNTTNSMPTEKTIEDFKIWFENHYGDDVEDIISQADLYETHSAWEKYVYPLFLATMDTMIIGAVTRFRVGIPSHAAWYLVWVYFGIGQPMMPPLRRRIQSLLAPRKYATFVALLPLALPFVAALFGGITVLEVELMEAMCQATWSLSAGNWVLVGFLTELAMSVTFLSLIFGLYMLGKAND
jgi:hypothetical protein